MPFGIPALITKTGNDKDLYVVNSSNTQLNSTVLLEPIPGSGTGRINTDVSGAGASGQLELGPTTTNYKAFTIYDNGSAVNGAGINIASTEPSTSGSGLNIVGPGTGAQANQAYIRVNTSTGAERVILASNPTVNNLVLSPIGSVFNTPVATALDCDVDTGGIFRRSNATNNQAIVVGCLQTDSGATTALVVPTPNGLITGLYAVLTGGNNSLPVGVSGTGSLMYWNGTAWSAGGSMNNPQTGGAGADLINQYGVRSTGGLGANLTFCNGTAAQVLANSVNVYIMLLLGAPSAGGQLAPFS
jgi:hypothetical protein